MHKVDLAGLLCSRLCHDLISPLGSLMNGLELLADEADPEARAHYIDMLNLGAKRAADKLTFFRLAFGCATGMSDLVATSEARAALEGVYGEAENIRLDWRVPQQALEKQIIKTLLALAMTAADAMIWGGRLLIETAEHDGVIDLRVSGSAERLLVAPDMLRVLNGHADARDVTPRAAVIYMVQELLARTGAALVMERPSDRLLELRARLARSG